MGEVLLFDKFFEGANDSAYEVFDAAEGVVVDGIALEVFDEQPPPAGRIGKNSIQNYNPSYHHV